MARIRLDSLVAASPESVWTRVISPEGINDELRPWLRMTIPSGLRGRTVDEVDTGRVLGRSRLLLLGVLPVDYDDLCLAEVDPGHRFLERSRMMSMRRWEHERTVTAAPRGALVTDRLEFELRAPLDRVPGAHVLAAAIVRRLFWHRHSRLASRFSAGRSASPPDRAQKRLC